MNKFKMALGVVALAGVSQFALADMAGLYVSKDQCQLLVEVLSKKTGYADATYALRSDGTAACEWTGAGVGKRTIIDAGIVSGSSRAFAELNWVFGPQGDKVEVTFFDTDGTKRYTESYEKAPQTAGK